MIGALACCGYFIACDSFVLDGPLQVVQIDSNTIL